MLMDAAQYYTVQLSDRAACNPNGQFGLLYLA